MSSAFVSPPTHPGRAGRPSQLSWMALLLSLGLLACPPTSNPPDVWEPEASNSLLMELRSLNGEPVPEAWIRLPSGEWTQADARGHLLLKNLPQGSQLLRVNAPGFASTSMAVNIDEGVRAGSRLEMLPLGEPVATFNTNTGHAFAKGGIHVSVPPGDLIDAEGHRLQGEVDAFLAPLDLEDLEKAELLAAPGAMMGELRPGEPPVLLESLGLMVLAFQQKTGPRASAQSEKFPGVSAQGAHGVSALARRLGIRGSVPGSVIAHSYPPSSGGPDASKPRALSTETLPQVPVWRLNPDSGLWVPTGDMATLVEASDPPGRFEWQVDLTSTDPIVHLALPAGQLRALTSASASASASRVEAMQVTPEGWREMGCLAVQVEAEDGQPVAGRGVVALGVDYASVSRAVTDARGRALLAVARDRTVRLDAGAGTTRMRTGSEAGTCTGQGAEPTPVTLRVPAPACRPGAERKCGTYHGPAGTEGVGSCQAPRQSCDVNGTGWSATCEGEVLPQQERCDNALDDDCDGTTNETCASLCEPGETRPCYEGLEGTRDVGVCRTGAQTCVAGGTAWSACSGQVLPRAEDCSRPQDENCDGVACQCWPGETQRCDYTGPAGTENVGICHAGTRTCDDSGTGWSACTVEVTPQVELCTNGLDDDCDGQLDECLWSTTSTMNMKDKRHKHRALLLSTGEVLVAGGLGPSGPLASSELYDPVAGTWSYTTGAMLTPRERFTMTLLSNGEVLVAGGTGPSGPLDTAELYDPVAKTWSYTTGFMKTARTEHTATLLSDGKVLISGGSTNGGAIKSAELYDPDAKTWSYTTGEMTTERTLHTATLLSDGKVLVVGGAGSSFLATAEVYDPNAETWSAIAARMSTTRSRHTATLLSDGKVLISGGENSSFLATSEEYDPDKKTWSAIAAPMSTTHTNHASLRLSNGRVLVTGGYGATHAEVYDPDKKTWSATSDLTKIIGEHAAIVLSDGQVLMCGGFGSPGGILDETWMYPP